MRHEIGWVEVRHDGHAHMGAGHQSVPCTSTYIRLFNHCLELSHSPVLLGIKGGEEVGILCHLHSAVPQQGVG